MERCCHGKCYTRWTHPQRQTSKMHTHFKTRWNLPTCIHTHTNITLVLTIWNYFLLTFSRMDDCWFSRISPPRGCLMMLCVMAETVATPNEATKAHCGAFRRPEQLCSQAALQLLRSAAAKPFYVLRHHRNTQISINMLAGYCRVFFFNLSLLWTSIRSAVFHLLLLGVTVSNLDVVPPAAPIPIQPSLKEQLKECYSVSKSIDFFSDLNLNSLTRSMFRLNTVTLMVTLL